jgi:hypothetical protein
VSGCGRKERGSHGKVQLWEDGPYWAETNIGAENPEDYGYYFWWGDTVGYKREDGIGWVASDGSARNFEFTEENTPTWGKSIGKLKSEGWITKDEVLAPKHDAAHVHWGGSWRMPTKQELEDLNEKCDWTWTTKNGVNGYIVQGRGRYASASIFLPGAGSGYGTSLDSFLHGYGTSLDSFLAGYGLETSLDDAGSYGGYWSSVPDSDSYYDNRAWALFFSSSGSGTYYYSDRLDGQSVRPVQGFTK